MKSALSSALIGSLFSLLLTCGSAAADPSQKAISFSLIDQDGAARTEASFGDSALVVFFGYTHCPDICPTSAQHMTVLLNSLPPELKDKVVPVFITADPDRDTPPKLKAFLASFDTRIVGLSGPLKSIDDLAWSMSVLIMRYGSSKDGASYMIDHTADYLLVRKGALAGRVPMTSTTDELIAKIRDVLK